MLHNTPAVHLCECAICQASTDAALAAQHAQINLLLSRLTEPQRRWYVGWLSQLPDAPSDRQLALITGLTRPTIQRGRRELAAGLVDLPPDHQRQAGGGRHPSEKKILP
jgi:hypothetical protein